MKQSNEFVSMLDSATQAAIEKDLRKEFENIFTVEEMAEAIDNALNSRLCDLSDIIDIEKYTIK